MTRPGGARSMKKLLLFALAVGGLSFLSGCAVDDDEVVRTTTVTEETTVRAPATVAPTTQTVITR